MSHTRGLMSSAQALRQIFIVSRRIPRAGILSNPLQKGLQLRSFQQSHCLYLREYRPPVRGPPRNEGITARTEEVLESFDHDHYFLLQVQAAEDGNLPVCKIYNKKQVRETEKAKAKAARAPKNTLKSIELNWAIDAHDLSHRLKQLTNFLDKGRKVEVILTSKRHKRRATVDEIKQVMQKVLDTVREAGANQIKPMEGEPGKVVTFTVQKDI
ncbi:uncharacterized protein N7511_003254 [Penicillium nucicola]|uniref:uncharacterized protein n=1 Tax=Penicillium nucicola TaxID=1850975 RepID=UPI00254566E6|nr:uncharacterized protein N7511_003254 [Penicillium nucicola]KAJ5771203.1 hypothetical protein N7511_003254 [Penicillium nucicola]